MKHGVPLTPFQERLYAIVLNAFKEPEKKHPVKPDTEKNMMEENTESITEQADISSKQCKDYPKDTWKDNVKFWSACYFELFVEHIHKIFITVMSMNILWIQIITSQMGIQKSYRGIIEIIKWVMLRKKQLNGTTLEHGSPSRQAAIPLRAIRQGPLHRSCRRRCKRQRYRLQRAEFHAGG